jgi:hypothetical protein
MLLPIIIGFVIVALFRWVSSHPATAKSLVAELKRRWRLRIIQKYGTLAADDFNREFRQRASKEGLPPEIVEQVVAESTPEMIRKLGSEIANQRLGEPTPLERYW